MLGEKAVRLRVAPISSAIAWKRLLKISSWTGSVRIEFRYLGNRPGIFQDEVQISIHHTSEVRRYQRSRTVLTNNRGTLNHVTVAKHGAVVYRCAHSPVIDPNRLCLHRYRSAALFRRFLKFRFFSPANKSTSHIDQLYRTATVCISVAALVCFMKSFCEIRLEFQHQFIGLSTITKVHKIHRLNFAFFETFGLQLFLACAM